MAGKKHLFIIFKILLFSLLTSGLFGGCWCVVVLPPLGHERAVSITKEKRNSEASYEAEVYTELPDGAFEAPVEEFNPEVPCLENERRSCRTSKKGICREGERICLSGKWTPCKQLLQASREVCDQLDNDCDGQVDEFMIRECPYSGPHGTKGKGPCKSGKQRCERGKWGTCVGEILPRPEICNGRDDDCDGAVDEWLPIQGIGKVWPYSKKGDSTHIYLTTTQTGYAFAWSEKGVQNVFLTRVNVDGSRYGKDWPVTKKPAYGNVHGFTYTGKNYVVAWDTDQGGGRNKASAYMAMFNQSGKKIQGPMLLQEGKPGVTRMVNPQVAYGPGFLGIIWSDFEKKILHAQTFDLQFKPLGKKHSFPVSIRSSPYPGLAFSKDRMATVWITTDNKVKIAVFDKKGHLVDRVTEVSVPSKSPENSQIIGFKDGFLVLWSDTGASRLWSQRLNRSGQPTEPPHTVLYASAHTPIMKTTSFGAVVAWVERRKGQKGISTARINKRGRLIDKPSWFKVPDVELYLALAWADLGNGMGRGAIAWITAKDEVKLAPLGCRK